MNASANIKAIMKREVGGYFTSPIAYVFLVIFLLLAGFFTFTGSEFNAVTNNADLRIPNNSADVLRNSLVNKGSMVTFIVRCCVDFPTSSIS